MAVWLSLLLLIVALIKSTNSQHTHQTEPQYMSLGYFKKSDKVLDTLLNQDYQETVQELARINRDYREYKDGFDRKNSKTLDDEISQDYQHQINILSPLINKRHVRSQRNRREKLNLQGVRSHRVHSLESGRRRRLQPNLPHIQPEE